MAAQTQAIEDYRAKLSLTHSFLPEIEKDATARQINSWDDYRSVWAVIGELTSLYCWAFNTKDQDFDRISLALLTLQRKARKWCESQTAKGDVKLALRYILWSKFIQNDRQLRPYYLQMLANSGRLWKDGSVYAATGLHLKIGDNTFNKNGARHYLYCCGAQAFRVEFVEDVEFLKTLDLPKLPDVYEVVGLCDGKGCARPLSLTRDEIMTVYSHFVALPR